MYINIRLWGWNSRFADKSGDSRDSGFIFKQKLGSYKPPEVFCIFTFHSEEKKKGRGGEKDGGGGGETRPASLLPFFKASCFHLFFLPLFPGIWRLHKEREGVITSEKGVGDVFKLSIRHAAPEQVACMVKYYLNNTLAESYV